MTPLVSRGQNRSVAEAWAYVFNPRQRSVHSTHFQYSARRALYVKRKIEARSRNHCCRGKAINIKYYWGVCVAVVIQLAKRMRHIIFSHAALLAVSYFSTLSHKRHNFRGKVTGRKMCVFIFSTTFMSNMSRVKKN